MGLVEFTLPEQEQIDLGLKNGLTKKQVAKYAKQKFWAEQMKEIRLGYQHGLTDEQVMTYAKQKFWPNQMKQIRLGYQNKLTDEQVKIYAKANVSANVMYHVRKELQKGLNLEKTKEIVDFKFAEYDVKHIAQIGFICKCLLKGIDKDLVKKFIRISSETSYYMGRSLDFDKLQICLEGLLNGLSVEAICVYAKPGFCIEQMREIYLGLINGLSMKQVEAYADKYIPSARMKKIRKVLLEMKNRTN